MKLPIRALKTIKHYCEKTQCRRCPYGQEYDGYVECELLQVAPCEWEIEEKQNESNISSRYA